MLAVMKKLTYDEEYNFENEVRKFCVKEKLVLIVLLVCIKLVFF